MSQNAKKFKYQLDLLEEKRAFVVIALTDRLTQSGKLAAMNALAHYNSEYGYAWASIPKMAVECGYAATSTKTIGAGLHEIERVGAFKIQWTKGGATKTHHVCPIMSWFRDEYDQLRKSGKIANDNDFFADVRDESVKPGSDPGLNDLAEITKAQDPTNHGSTPGLVGSKTRATRVQNPTKRTDEENRQKRKNLNGIAPACGERGPVGGFNADFADEADGHSVTTSDCMSKLQQFAFMSQIYQRRFDRPVTDKDREAFLDASDSVGFELMLTNIGLADRHHSFADCVNVKVWHPNDDPDAFMQDEPGASHTNNSQLPPDRKAGGIDWVNDPPF